MRPLSSVVTSVSNMSNVTLRRANESGPASAGSSDAGAARMATCSVPPYCGRVSACAAAITASRALLTARDRHTKRFITPCLSIPGHRDCRVALGLGPQCRDRAGKIHRRADRYRISIGKFIRAHRVLRVVSRRCGQYLPARSTCCLHSCQVTAPTEPRGLVTHPIQQLHLAVDGCEEPQRILLAR